MKFLNIENRFWSKVNKEGTNGCWEWIGSKRGRGYGSVSFKGKMYAAHRVSYVLANGDVLGHLHVLHKCDNTACVNPDHLFLGTNTDNVKDKMEKGRHKVKPSYGQDNGQSKLTIDQILEIKNKYIPRAYSQQKIATEYGVDQSVISRILSGKIWKIS